MDAAEVSVVVLAYQSGGTLERCLAALKAQTVQGFETIVADNASSDGAPQAAAKADPGLRLIDNGGNIGFAAGNNRAAEQARGRWLVLLNPDAYAQADWLAQLLACARAHPRARCFTARQKMAQDPARLDGLGDAMAGIGFPFRGGYGAPDPGPMPDSEVFSPCGAAMMIDRALFLQLGGFDESFFCYCEDVDLGYRLRLTGEPVVLAAGAVVLHEGSVSTGGRRSDFSIFHGVRNRLWLFVKDTPPVLLWLTLPFHIAATVGVWVRATVRGHAEPVEQGLEAAVKQLPEVWRRRRAVQATRKVSSLRIAGMMVWNPRSVMRRKGWIRSGIAP
ncbi:MAG: glycosyl transferase family 2 [Caulobacteraceae bacterium]|nr:glycosyl transferase family 2 [Caulobacteraceae bacterium]